MPSPFELNETIGNESHVCSKPGIHHSPSPCIRQKSTSPNSCVQKNHKNNPNHFWCCWIFWKLCECRNPACQASFLIFKQRGEVIPDRNIHPNLQWVPFIIQPTYVTQMKPNWIFCTSPLTVTSVPSLPPCPQPAEVQQDTHSMAELSQAHAHPQTVLKQQLFPGWLMWLSCWGQYWQETHVRN